MLSDIYAFLITADTSALDTDRATAIATIRTMCGTRMFPDVPDEGSTLPALSYFLVSESTDHTIDGANDGLFYPRFQIDVWSLTALERETVGSAVKTALDGYTQTAMGGTFVNALLWDNEIDQYEEDRKQFRKILDFKFVTN